MRELYYILFQQMRWTGSLFADPWLIHAIIKIDSYARGYEISLTGYQRETVKMTEVD